ncbi:MAG: hypothetical protein GY803_02230 [Chloroflexi bacterium]|nr:hypothetical protein [Chloroflexota bacterium]
MNTQTSVEISTEQAPKKRLVPTLYIVLGIILLLALAGLFIWGMIWLAQNQAPAVEAVRDIFIIALALESCLFGIVLIILLVMVVRLVNMMEFEIKPILEKTNETVGMVRGTTVFVSENVVRPVTKANSYVAAVRRGVKTLFGNPDKLLED